KFHDQRPMTCSRTTIIHHYVRDSPSTFSLPGNYVARKSQSPYAGCYSYPARLYQNGSLVGSSSPRCSVSLIAPPANGPEGQKLHDPHYLRVSASIGIPGTSFGRWSLVCSSSGAAIIIF
ncbi:MAG: hypothetical protein IPO69_00260, partial [Saprospiraceae bacterium]|nr:hypothetical protein [Saprospiraceae bacterium]